MLIAEFKLTEDFTDEVMNDLSTFINENSDKSKWVSIDVLSCLDNITYSVSSLKEITSSLEKLSFAGGIKFIFAYEPNDSKDHVLDITLKLFDDEPKINTDLILA